MGAGRRTETYLGSHAPSEGSSSPSVCVQFLNLPASELASVIFGCTRFTYDECVQQLIFGLPKGHISYVEKVHPGMPLFLFNYSDRKLHGIFEADSKGDLNLNPYGWVSNGAGKTPYPAQVRVRVKQLCDPLLEREYKEAIGANYYTETHFFFELNHVQTDMLISLFMRNAKSLDSLYMTSQAGPPASQDNPYMQAGPLSRGDEDGWIKPKKTTRPFMDAWHNAAPFIPTSAESSATLSNGRVATPEHWDDGCEDDEKAEENSVDSDGAFKKQIEASAEELTKSSLDWRSNVLLSNSNTREFKEDQNKGGRKLEILEKLRQLEKLKGQSSVEAIHVQDKLQGETSATTGSTKVQDSALCEWEQLARERCLQEQTMLREERDQLREKLQALDAPIAKTISKNLELCASAIAQMRQDELKLRHLMDDAFNQGELLKELDQLKKKNATLEFTQVRMASELEGLKAVVARLSQQVEALQPNNEQSNKTSCSQMNSRQERLEPLQEIYLIGGHDGQSWLGIVDVLFPATYEFTSAAPMLTARSYAAASVLMGSIYVFGGGNGRLWYETVETYNKERDEWISCPSMSLKRGSLAGATVGDRIFAIGGGNGQVYFADVECYDAHLGMWISSTSMLNKRFGVAAAELNGALYAIGGYNDRNYLASAERFDPREALWTTIAPMNRKRGSLSAVALEGKIYAIGGYDGNNFLNAVEFYEPRMNSWIEMEMGMHTGRAYAAVGRVGKDLYMFGGLNGGVYVETVECYRENSGWNIVEDVALGGRCFLACAVLE